MRDLNNVKTNNASERETLYIIPFVKDTFWSKEHKEVFALFKERKTPMRNIICVESVDTSVKENNFDNDFYKKMYELSGITFYKINLVEGNDICIEGFNTLLLLIKDRLLEKEYSVKIIMNPPYKGSLHLKIASKMKEQFPTAKIVNLSPMRWLQDPLAERKKDSDWKVFGNLREGLEELYPILAADSNKYFGTEQIADLGIYVISEKGGLDLNPRNTIIEKVLDRVNGIPTKKVTEVSEEKYFVPINLIQYLHRERGNYTTKVVPFLKDEDTYGRYYHKGKSDNGRTLSENKDNNKHSTTGKVENYKCVEFNSVEEALNFRSFVKSKLFTYILDKECLTQNITPKYLPFMPDYTRPWSDQELYEYFELTEDEIKIVEEFFEDISKQK